MNTPNIGTPTNTTTEAINRVTQALTDTGEWTINHDTYDAHSKAEDIVANAFMDAAIIIVPEWLRHAEDLSEVIITTPTDASDDAVEIYEPSASDSDNPEDWTKWLPLSEVEVVWNGEQYIND